MFNLCLHSNFGYYTKITVARERNASRANLLIRESLFLAGLPFTGVYGWFLRECGPWEAPEGSSGWRCSFICEEGWRPLKSNTTSSLCFQRYERLNAHFFNICECFSFRSFQLIQKTSATITQMGRINRKKKKKTLAGIWARCVARDLKVSKQVDAS